MENCDKKEVELIELTDEQRRVYFKALDYDINEDGFVVDSKNEPVICPYSKEKVRFDNASILPGSTIVMNTDALTIAEYLTAHPNIRFKDE